MTIESSMLPLQRLYHWANTQGKNVYMVQPLGKGQVREYSWAETLDEAKRMAAYLQKQGYPQGSSISILSKNCAEFIIADLAIWMAGYVSVAIYPTLTAESVNYILEHSESRLLFVGKLDTWEDMALGVPNDMPKVSLTQAPLTGSPQWQDIIANTSPLESSPVRDEDDAAIIIYTSGSTGRPKGVVHSFRSMVAPCVGFEALLGFNTSDRQLSYLPLAHAFERAVVENLSIYSGSKVYFAETLDTFAQDLQRAKPTVFHSVPRLWLKFQAGVHSKLPPGKLSKLLKIPFISTVVRKKVLSGLGLDECRFALSGSAPIPPELINWYKALGLELLEGYGMSENFAYSHGSIPGNARVGYVGNTFPSVEHKLSDDGEILVKSPANMVGYFKMEEETQKAFTEDGFLKTGDRGELDSQGRLKITGRVKELFKTSKGKYIAPAPIENIINASPWTELSCVAGSSKPACHAVVTLAEDVRPKANEPGMQKQVVAALTALLEEVNSQVDPHERLQFIAVAKEEWQIENGLLTPTMKIKRNLLEDTYAPKLDDWYNSKQKVIWE